MKQVQNCHEDALAHQHVGFRGVVQAGLGVLPAGYVAVGGRVEGGGGGGRGLELAGGEVSALDCVAVDYVEEFVHVDSGTALFCE